MFSANRRRFLRQVSTAGIACSANFAFGRFLSAQTPTSNPSEVVKVYVDSRRTMAPLDRNLFGSFLEHLGRAIYEGIYDPGSKLSDSNGFRKDVMDEIRQLGVPIIRYPGRKFCFRLQLARRRRARSRTVRGCSTRRGIRINTNQFGTNEFMAWCKAVGTRAADGPESGHRNRGTSGRAGGILQRGKGHEVERSAPQARHRRALQSEALVPGQRDGWPLADRPHDGHRVRTESRRTRRGRCVTSILRFNSIACGSSGPVHAHLSGVGPRSPGAMLRLRGRDSPCIATSETLPEETGRDSSKFLAMNLSMERQIAETLAVCDLVRGHKRSPKKLWLSFDEWNVWYRARSGDAVNGHGQEAPHLAGRGLQPGRCAAGGRAAQLR